METDGVKKVLFSPPNFRDVTNTQQIKEQPYPEFLISEWIEEIDDMVDEYHVSVVNADVDTGRLLALPYFLTREGRYKVTVIMEREEENLDELVSFQKEHGTISVGKEPYTSNNLVYLSYSTAIRELLSNKVHGGNWAGDVLVVDRPDRLLLSLLPSLDKRVRILFLTSDLSTLDKFFPEPRYLEICQGCSHSVELKGEEKDLLTLLNHQLDLSLLKLENGELKRFMMKLRDAGAVDRLGTITSVGKVIADLSLKFLPGLFIASVWDLILKEDVERREKLVFRTVLAVACLIETIDELVKTTKYENLIFLSPDYSDRVDKEVKLKEYRRRYHKRFMGETDIHVLTNLFWSISSDIDLIKQYDLSTRYNFINHVEEWCRINMVNCEFMKRFLIKMQKLEDEVESLVEQELNLGQVLTRTGQNPALRNFSSGRELPDGGYTVLGSSALSFFLDSYGKIETNTFVLDENGDYRRIGDLNLRYEPVWLLKEKVTAPVNIVSAILLKRNGTLLINAEKYI